MRPVRVASIALLLSAAACQNAAGGDFTRYGTEGAEEATSEQEPADEGVYTYPGTEGTPEAEQPGTGTGGAAGQDQPPPSEPGGAGGSNAEPEPEPEPEPGADSGSPEPEPPTGCTYPSGPYGAVQNSTVAPNLSWQGYAPGSNALVTLTPPDFFDCDGSAGINALVIVYGAGWCSACVDEAGALPQQMSTWGPAGVRVLYLLWQTSGGGPADAAFAQQWRDYFALNDVYVAADPVFQLDSPAADALPFKMIVDPRTMRIVSTYSGEIGDDEVMQLALSNQ